MEKKLVIEFDFGKRIEIDAELVANLIAEKDAGDSHSDRVSELLNDELKFFGAIWNLPWIELYPHVPLECNEQPRAICVCNEWRKRNAKISINW